MDIETKNTRIYVRDAATGLELPYWRLTRTGLNLLRMDQPGPLLLDLSFREFTVVTVRIDGKQVLQTDILPPGMHNLTGPELTLTPAEAAAHVDEAAPAEDVVSYLQSLGVEPDQPTTFVMPYIGEKGGVLNIRFGYKRFDNGVAHEHNGDELTFKVMGKDAYLRSLTENVHRLVIDEDPEQKKHGDLCGFSGHHDPAHHAHNH
jgi:hypothetical protein